MRHLYARAASYMDRWLADVLNALERRGILDETLVYYMRAESIDLVREVYAHSTHAIDAYHQRFKDETFEHQALLELLVDFETL